MVTEPKIHILCTMLCFYNGSRNNTVLNLTNRGETRAFIGGGGGEYSYIHVLPDEIFFLLNLMTADFKRNSLAEQDMNIHHPPPPPQINALVLPLLTKYMQFLDRLYSVLYVVLELTLLCISFQGNNSRVVLLNVFNGRHKHLES